MGKWCQGAVRREFGDDFDTRVDVFVPLSSVPVLILQLLRTGSKQNSHFLPSQIAERVKCRVV
jgi:hypothetical protein